MQEFDVYLAAPLFSAAELAYNLLLTHGMENLGLSVFLPQRDGLEYQTLTNLPPGERNARIYELDIKTLKSCPILVAVLDGRVPDEGVCVELGTARGHSDIAGNQKLILGLKTDTRMWQPDAVLNPMISGCLDALINSTDSLLDYLQAFARIVSISKENS